jgi:HEAT repeat protein
MKLFGGRKPADDGPPPEIAELVARLSDADPARRLAAARALGELGPRAAAAVSALEAAITDDDGDVCNAAAQALSRIERDL